ncbi:DMT family transporter [bacterium]|jgi:drug/metabolite transporter (DMT)-like permease|nr:DMT family transporter [bacterium]
MRYLAGCLYMGLFCFLMPLTDVIARILVEGGLSATQIIMLRSCVIISVLLPWLWIRKELAVPRHLWKWYAMRSLFFFSAVSVWLSILEYVPLADLYAVGFSAPIFAALLSVIFLGDRLTGPRIVGIVGGLLGSVIVTRPGLREIDPHIWLAFLCALFWAGGMVVSKHLSGKQSHGGLVFYLSLSFIFLSATWALPDWTVPSMSQWGLLVLIGLMTLVAHLVLLEAFERAPLTVLTPIDFSTLVFSAIFGWMFFQEGLDMYTALGGLVIFASATYTTLRTKAA